jgi:hypothetical protein
MGAFGVELPDNINELHSGEPAPEAAPEKVEVAPEKAPEELTAKEIVELEKLEKFKFNGQELTLKDLQNQILMRKDYTQKTQELGEARKFVDNFDIDLDKVIANPSLMKQFKGIYPASYVEKAEKILKMAWKDTPQTGQTTQAQGAPPAMELPQEILAKLDRVDQLERWMNGQEQEKQTARQSVIETQLDDWFKDLSSKYQFADPDAVLTKAQAFADAGHKVDKEMLDKIFAEKDGHYQKAWATTQQQKQKQQLKVGAQAKEAGRGGDVPSAAPQEAKTLKDVRKNLLKSLE